jgi:agmatine deiminase
MKVSTSSSSIEDLFQDKHLHMPAEWYPHERCWMLWPYRKDNWNRSALPAQKAFLTVAKAISDFEPVTLAVPAAHMNDACKLLEEMLTEDGKPFQCKHTIDFIETESNDAWMRDMGPTFLLRKSGSEQGNKLYGMDWTFNAWGRKYSDWKADDQVASQVISFTKAERIRTEFICEGGAIHVDGEGTILTTEECLRSLNRNPSLSKEEIEEKLLSYLGGEKVIWLPWGIAHDDDTNGHIDNFCCFTAPGEALLCWTDNINDENYYRCRLAMKVLEKVPDAKGRMIKVRKMIIPTDLHYKEADLNDLIFDEGEESYRRIVGAKLAGSYVNFYVSNGGIIAPALNEESDEIAKGILQEAFSSYKIVMVPARDILLGGGNIHCITQQQPAL